MPLAPLAEVRPTELPGIIDGMKKRPAGEVKASEAAQLWTATYVLMGLRYDQALADELLKGVREMEESVTYQEIIRKGKAEGKAEGRAEGKAEGAAEEAQRILLRVGTRHLGTPDETTRGVICQLFDRDRLEELIERASEVASWQELLSTPRPRRGSKSRRQGR